MLTEGAGVWAWGLNLHYLHLIKIVCDPLWYLTYIKKLSSRSFVSHRTCHPLFDIPLVIHPPNLRITSRHTALQLSLPFPSLSRYSSSGSSHMATLPLSQAGKYSPIYICSYSYSHSFSPSSASLAVEDTVLLLHSSASV